MGKLNFKVHPLFILIGIYFAFTGKVFSFLTYTFSALVHELGHSIMAQKVGYRLVNVTLMPFGAVVKGDISGMGYQDEIRVALFGPIVNLCIAVALVALWWIAPELYPYTELAVSANLALCLINLIPAFPLDGGRVLFCTLSLFMQSKKATFICKCVGATFGFALLALFVYSCFTGVNFTILLFAVFVLLGVFEKNSNGRYVKLFQSLSADDLKNGKKIKTFAVSEDFTVKKLYSKMDGGYLYRIYVYDKKGFLKRILEPHDVVSLLQNSSVYEKIC